MGGMRYQLKGMCRQHDHGQYIVQCLLYMGWSGNCEMVAQEVSQSTFGRNWILFRSEYSGQCKLYYCFLIVIPFLMLVRTLLKKALPTS